MTKRTKSRRAADHTPGPAADQTPGPAPEMDVVEDVPAPAPVAAAPVNPGELIRLTRSLAAKDEPDEILRLARTVQHDKPDLADWMLRVATTALPNRPQLTEAFCNLPEANGDLAKAANRWTQMRRRAPRQVDNHLGYLNLMIRHGRFDEAERAVHSALKAAGQQPRLNEIHAGLAGLRGDWTEAARRWGDLAEHRPAEFPEAAQRQHEAQAQALAAPAAPQHQAVTVPPVPATTEAELAEIRKLLMGFESLGYNCEFGLLQRKFKGEPVSLLRFSSTFPSTLLALLKSRFAGLGDPDHMQLKLSRRQYGLSHAFSNWIMHTGILTGKPVDRDKLLKDLCKHATYLRRKLIDDLEEPSKIFVLQKPDLADDMIDRIYQALQTFGPCMLLCVRLHDRTHPAGTLTWRADRLAIAAIDRVGNANPGSGWDISVDYWVHFCRLTQARWDELQAVPLEAARA